MAYKPIFSRQMVAHKKSIAQEAKDRRYVKRHNKMNSRMSRHCKKCNSNYTHIVGLKHFDEGYCTEKCFIFRDV